MAKGIPESGTISLSDLKAAFRAGSVIQTNTYSTAANGSITAPAAATWVKIEVYGGGGGGCGYGGTEQGGGGGGYSKYEMPVTGSVTTFGYRVGGGGNGGTSGNIGLNGNYSWANGIPTLGTMYAYGGYGGNSTQDAGQGGSVEFDIVGNPSTQKKRGDWEYGGVGGTGTYYYGGDAGGPSGGTGGRSSGAAGSAPGGGGSGGYTLFASGGAGATGRVIFTWYNIGSTQSLRDFIGGGSICDRTVTGNNKNIPVSGTISLKDFYSADELGYNANSYPSNTGTQFVESYYDSVQKGDTAVATANLAISNSTGSMTHAYAIGKAFDKALDTTIDTELLSRFQIQFTRTVQNGGTITGSAVNTWITLNFGPRWYLNVSRSSLGTSSNSANGFLRFRRVDNNQEVVNVAVYMFAQADVSDDFDTK